MVKKSERVIALMQATNASSKEEIEEREIAALIAAAKVTKCSNLMVITWNYGDIRRMGKKKITFIPLWKWLLEGAKLT